MFRYLYQLCFVLLVLSACQSTQKPVITTPKPQQISATIIKESFVDCFAEGTTVLGKPVWCEASATLFDGQRLLFANDKPMPNLLTSVFYWYNIQDFEAQKPASYRFDETLKTANKFEDFALSPNKKWIFLTTAFDRIKEENNEWNGYNVLFYWESEISNTPNVLSTKEGEITSIKLREMMASALALNNLDYLGLVRYFKVEGLAATDDKLYFGIREEGNRFDDFKYVTKILSIPYKVEQDPTTQKSKIVLAGSFDLVADIKPQLQTQDILPKGLALSSIEYDATRQLFWMLTSYESGTNVGGYLWTATLEQLKNNKMTLVRSANNVPLTFSHKPEDLTFLSENKLLIIHDDDRLNTTIGNQTRKPYQAAYSIVELK
jgi:hypothetical protein